MTRTDATRMPSSRRKRAPVRREPPPLRADCALFLDIDGTLLDLAATPDSVTVDQAIAALLPALAYRLGGATALITGRTIADADALFPGIGQPVAGQHGLERRGADGVLHAHGKGPAGLAWLRVEVTHLVDRHPGLMLEDKGATLAVHYRLVPALASYVHRTLKNLVATSGAAGADWRLQPGKGIVEIKPAGRDKGAAILDYMAEPTFAGRLPVFVGDDQTDEFGFSAVARLGGWAVKVGPGLTHAQFRLRDVNSVRRWLAALLRQPSIPGAHE